MSTIQKYILWRCYQIPQNIAGLGLIRWIKRKKCWITARIDQWSRVTNLKFANEISNDLFRRKLHVLHDTEVNTGKCSSVNELTNTRRRDILKKIVPLKANIHRIYVRQIFTTSFKKTRKKKIKNKQRIKKRTGIIGSFDINFSHSCILIQRKRFTFLRSERLMMNFQGDLE